MKWSKTHRWNKNQWKRRKNKEISCKWNINKRKRKEKWKISYSSSRPPWMVSILVCIWQSYMIIYFSLWNSWGYFWFKSHTNTIWPWTLNYEFSIGYNLSETHTGVSIIQPQPSPHAMLCSCRQIGWEDLTLFKFSTIYLYHFDGHCGAFCELKKKIW